MLYSFSQFSFLFYKSSRIIGGPLTSTGFPVRRPRCGSPLVNPQSLPHAPLQAPGAPWVIKGEGSLAPPGAACSVLTRA